jgi:hypothetical protein
MLTLQELKEKVIEQIDEVDLLEILNLNTEDIVNAFEDLVEDNMEKIEELLELPDLED